MARRSSSNSSGVKLTPQVRAQIVQDFETGMPVEEITSKHGLTHSEYVRRIIRKEKGDDVLPKTPPTKGNRRFAASSVTNQLNYAGKLKTRSTAEEVSDAESNHSYSLRERKSVTPSGFKMTPSGFKMTPSGSKMTPSGSQMTPSGRCRRPSHERYCGNCDSGSVKRKKARVLSPVEEPQHDELMEEELMEEESEVGMPEAGRDLFGTVECYEETGANEVAESNNLTPQMIAQLNKRESDPNAGSTIGSGLKTLFNGSLFGTKFSNFSFQNTSFQESPPGHRSINLSPTRRSVNLSPTSRSVNLSPTRRSINLSPTRRSVNLSPIFDSHSQAAQTSKENVVDKSYVDFLVRTHQEELQARDDMIADRDRTIAELERENRSLSSEVKRLQNQESLEKKWKKYF